MNAPPMALPMRDAQKLARILDMLGSTHGGERDAAALAANNLVREHGLTWLAILGVELAADMSEPTDAEMVKACLDRKRCLSDWEVDFIRSIAALVGRGRRLSAKQKAVLVRLYEVAKERAHE